MKVVQLNTVFDSCSTGRIAAQLYRLAGEAGFESLAAWGRGPSPAARCVRGYKNESFPEFCLHVAYGFAGLSGFGSGRATARLLSWLDSERPDVLHLHNIHGFWLDVEMLFQWIKARGVPVVWTLHDAWPITGHCAFFEEIGCRRWITGCNNCPIHSTRYPYSFLHDGSRRAWLRKRAAFTGVGSLTIVTPSRWLGRVVSASYLGCYETVVIPNGVDLSLFTPDGPVPQNLPGGGKPIVLGVANVWERRKGLHHLRDMAILLGEEAEVVAIGVGMVDRLRLLSSGPLPRNLHLLPRTKSPSALAAWYRAAAVFVNPTLDDNFPTSNLEALACGTPVVAFDAGGAAEAISEECGESVQPTDTVALAASVRKWIRKSTAQVRKACRRHAQTSYSADCCLRRYLPLYSRQMSQQDPIAAISGATGAH